MDDHGMDDPGTDPHGFAHPDPEHDGLDQHGAQPHGGHPDAGPQPGLDDPGAVAGLDDGVDGGWPHDAGYPDHLDPDLPGAQTADLSFAEDYHAGDLHDLGGVEEPLFGADPDLHPLAGAGLGDDQPFPPALGLDPPEPIDGYPWIDPGVLGHDLLPAIEEPGGGPHPAELFEYAGEQPPADGAGWPALLASPDPATSALARWWSGR